MESPQAGDGQHSNIRSHWLPGAVPFHCPRYLSRRFAISSSLMDCKHQKETTQKMDSTTFTRWGTKCGRNLLSGLQSRNTTRIDYRRFSFVSKGILSTLTHEC